MRDAGSWGLKSRRDAGYGIKIAWRDRDALISIGGMWDSFEIDSGMQDFSDPLKI